MHRKFRLLAQSHIARSRRTGIRAQAMTTLSPHFVDWLLTCWELRPCTLLMKEASVGPLGRCQPAEVARALEWMK